MGKIPEVLIEEIGAAIRRALSREAIDNPYLTGQVIREVLDAIERTPATAETSAFLNKITSPKSD